MSKDFFKKQNLKEALDIDEILNDIRKKDAPERYGMFILGCFLSALVFNVFFDKYDIVTGGATGLAVSIDYLYGIEPSKFVFVVSLLLLIVSLIFLGFKNTLRSVLGTILYPLFMKITALMVPFLNVESRSLLLISLYGGVLYGFATGLIMKTGFTVGGFNILYQVLNKYKKISIGKSSLVVNSLVLAVGYFVFGLPRTIYAIIALYIASVITDKVMLGIHDNKTFYIITDKDKKMKEYILRKLNHGVTVFNVKGGKNNDKKKMLMCVIPTKEYFNLKEIVKKIDNEAFFLITDSYEASGEI